MSRSNRSFMHDVFKYDAVKGLTVCAFKTKEIHADGSKTEKNCAAQFKVSTTVNYP
jgi:hypothetical protein